MAYISLSTAEQYLAGSLDVHASQSRYMASLECIMLTERVHELSEVLSFYVGVVHRCED